MELSHAPGDRSHVCSFHSEERHAGDGIREASFGEQPG